MKFKKFISSFLFVPLLFSCGGNKDTSGSYTLTCNANGGVFSSNESSTISYANKSSVSSVEEPIYTGYNFEGWYTSKSLTSDAISFPYTLSKDTTIYAHWSDASTTTYTITLNAQAGVFSDGSTTKTISKVSKLYKSNISSPTPNNSNYEFKGWSKTSSGTTLISFPFTPTSDTTLYAIYGAKSSTYTLTCYANEGTFASNNSSTKTISNQSSVTIANLEKPSRSGYNFLGWFDGTKSSATQYTGTILLSKDTSIYAQWEEREEVAFELTDSSGQVISAESGVYNINQTSEDGTYNLKGDLTSGYINITGDDTCKVTLNLNNTSLSNDESSNSASELIVVSGIDKLVINVTDGTTNYITDSRTYSVGVSGAAILCDADLKIEGTGTLNVTSSYNNAIHCKKDLKMTESTIYAKAINTAIRGNDSITVDSGYISATSVNGSGFKTSCTKTKKSGTGQRGTIEINGGTIVCNSFYDAFDAAYNVEVNNEPTITVNTGTNADIQGKSVTLTDLYIKTTVDLKNNSIFAYCNSSSATSGGNWSTVATFEKEEEVESRMGEKTIYYYFRIKDILSISTYTNYGLYVFPSGTETPSFSGYSYYSSMKSRSITSTYNMAVLSNLSSSKKTMSYSWSSYESLSKKAFKADNAIIVNGGDITVTSEEDAIHANYPTTKFDSGLSSVGEVNINGGLLTLNCGDDGIHSDNVVNITDGTINITNSVEGIEAPYININGGDTRVYATDDGLNACGEDQSGQLINITGGRLEIEVSGDDVDGMDSNDSISQSGGVVITKVLSGGGMSSGIDCSEGTYTLTGGIVLAIGPTPESAPKNITVKSYSTGKSSGTWKVTNSNSSNCPFTYTNSKSISGTAYLYTKDSGTFAFSQ